VFVGVEVRRVSFPRTRQPDSAGRILDADGGSSIPHMLIPETDGGSSRDGGNVTAIAGFFMGIFDPMAFF
jgi:hypothetical protein